MSTHKSGTTWELHTGAAQLQEQDFVRTLAEEACGTDQPGGGPLFDTSESLRLCEFT